MTQAIPPTGLVIPRELGLSLRLFYRFTLDNFDVSGNNKVVIAQELESLTQEQTIKFLLLLYREGSTGSRAIKFNACINNKDFTVEIFKDMISKLDLYIDSLIILSYIEYPFTIALTTEYAIPALKREDYEYEFDAIKCYLDHGELGGKLSKLTFSDSIKIISSKVLKKYDTLLVINSHTYPVDYVLRYFDDICQRFDKSLVIKALNKHWESVV